MSGSIVLACALGLDALMGEPRWLWSRLPHPAVLMGRAVSFFDRTLNAPPAQRFKGALAIASLVLSAALLGWVVTGLGPVAEILVAAVLLAQRSLVSHVAAVADGTRHSLSEGRRAVGLIVSRDVSDTDGSGIARAAIESLSENFSDGVVAPAFWFLIGGLPGILIYKVVNTADSMIGYLTPRHAEFGWAAAKLDDLLNWVPARLTALIVATVTGQMHRLSAISSDARLHRSPNAGWPEAAMARALNVALAGPRTYHGIDEELAWVNGGGRRSIGPRDIDDAVRVVWKSWWVMLAGSITIGVVSWFV
ncbi:MAG: adenosylcobinamide-phosphate synthase CbiB [Tateyamaria sp.]